MPIQTRISVTKARLAGPPAVSSRRRDHVELLESAGFTDIEETDLTEEYLETARAWLRARERNPDAFRAVESAGSIGSIEKSRASVAGIEDGLLGRALFAAVRA